MYVLINKIQHNFYPDFTKNSGMCQYDIVYIAMGKLIYFT